MIPHMQAPASRKCYSLWYAAEQDQALGFTYLADLTANCTALLHVFWVSCKKQSMTTKDSADAMVYFEAPQSRFYL